MKKYLVLLSSLMMAGIAQAALQPGDHISPYTIQNVATGEEYCQVCRYGAKPAKLVAFGKLGDASFWADLVKIQALQKANPSMGAFAQIIDSKDLAAIKAEAAKHGITFPVVIPVEKDWNSIYDVNGVSRVIYYAQKRNNIVWSKVGLEDKDLPALKAQVKKDLNG